MVAIVLVQPEIPPNTGNIIRLSANTGAELHLVEPLGFRLTDRELRRAGLDYHEYARVVAHPDWASCRAAVDARGTRHWYALTTRGTLSTARFAPTTCSYSVARPRDCPPPSWPNSLRKRACACRCERRCAASIFPMPSRLPSTRRGGKPALPAPPNACRGARR